MNTAMRMTLAMMASCAAMTAVAGDDSATSEVSGEIVAACTVTAENGSFGQVPVDQAGQTVDTTVNLSVQCSSSVAYQLTVEPEVPMEFTTNTDLAAGNPATSSSLTFSGNTLNLFNGAGPIGALSYWLDSSKTTPVDVGTPTGSRIGTGAEETIPVTLAWVLPSSGSLTTESFGAWRVTNTYRVVF